MEASEEVDERQLELAREAGDAYGAALHYMVEEVVHSGGSQRAGDFVVAYAQEEAEGLYEPRGDGDLEWVEPDDENCHLEIAVTDAADGRFVPHLSVQATLTAEDGSEVGPVELPFLWHPGLFHYGANLTLPGDGRYDLQVRVEPPTFHRHDRTNGRRYAEPVTVTFEGVDIETGQG